MKELSDYSNLKTPTFWKTVTAQAKEAAGKVEELFTKAMETPLTQEEAVLALDMLFIDSHARIKKARAQLASVTPLTKQFTKNKLKLVEELWWVDHFTGGLNPFSTINTYIQRNVSTHFILDFHGRPLYVVPLCHGAWHEPRRNKDSVAIEMVNPGALTQTSTQAGPVWNFWAGPLPLDLIQKLPPVRLPKPYRGASALLPFTRDQIVNNLLLKRIVIAAFPGKFIPERMTQHSDWRETKTDMSPLWPLADINAAVFENDPILEYRFIQEYEEGLEAPGHIEPPVGDDPTDNPQYAVEPVDKGYVEWDTTEVQEFLVMKMHYSLKVDGKMGPKTTAAVKDFQRFFNGRKPETDPAFLKIDGIPGPKTVRAMQSQNH
jgi:N-acetyl-anhydromuramyl-L-alanine amidase AmpD